MGADGLGMARKARSVPVPRAGVNEFLAPARPPPPREIGCAGS